MGHKTRSNYAVGACFKPCRHKNTKVCDDCIKFSNFEMDNQKIFDLAKKWGASARKQMLRNILFSGIEYDKITFVGVKKKNNPWWDVSIKGTFKAIPGPDWRFGYGSSG